jgi:hypothetical protein
MMVFFDRPGADSAAMLRFTHSVSCVQIGMIVPDIKRASAPSALPLFSGPTAR